MLLFFEKIISVISNAIKVNILGSYRSIFKEVLKKIANVIAIMALVNLFLLGSTAYVLIKIEPTSQLDPLLFSLVDFLIYILVVLLAFLSLIYLSIKFIKKTI